LVSAAVAERRDIRPYSAQSQGNVISDPGAADAPRICDQRVRQIAQELSRRFPKWVFYPEGAEMPALCIIGGRAE